MNCENFYVALDENIIFPPSFYPLLYPQFNVHLDTSTTPPLIDVFVAQQEHISLNLEKIIVFPAQEIPRLTLMAPQT